VLKKIKNKIIKSIKKQAKIKMPEFFIPKWLSNGLAIFFISSLLVICLVFVYQKAYAYTYFPGATLTNTSLRAKTAEEARSIAGKKIDSILKDGLTIVYNDEAFILIPSPLTTNPDISFDLFSINTDNALHDLFQIGRQGNWFTKIQQQLTLFIFSPDYKADYYVNEAEVKKLLIQHFNQYETTAKDATIFFANEKIDISHEQYGSVFDYEEIITKIKNRLANLNTEPINISLKTDYPNIYNDQLQLVIKQTQNMLTLAPLTLYIADDISAQKKKWGINQTELASLITAKKISEGKQFFTFLLKLKKDKNSQVAIGLNLNALEQLLATKASSDIDQKPINAKFTINGKKVSEFKSSRSGQKLNVSASAEKIEKTLTAVALSTTEKMSVSPLAIELIVEEVASEITNENVNNLGIIELIGTGYSSFAGSPHNRRHNIATGAMAVHGTLIAPGEEFSLIKTLGVINASTGYLPELVIKGDETIPEYGGGLCQIGTTVFRASLETGLPITERRNHSYRVSYYEPAGTDATIYDPAPDFKFKNDTNNYILIQRRIEGSNLYFDFWGTNDQRKIIIGKPNIYNITQPPPTKLIETDELVPREKKCTEQAHNGADANFYYKVEYPDGEVKEETFYSHYRPWQEVCLVGKATSTPVLAEEIEKILAE